MIIHELLDELILFSILKGEQKTGYQVRHFIDRTFGYPTSFGSIFPHLDKMIEGGVIRRTDDILSVTPRGKVKYNALLDELLLIQSKLTPEIFTLDTKSITDRIDRLEEFQQRQRDALNPPKIADPAQPIADPPKITVSALQEQLEQIKQQKPQKVIFKKVKSLESRNSAAKTIGPTVPDEIRNLPGHSEPPIDYNKLSPEQRRVVDAQNSAEKVAAIPKALLTGTRSFNIDKIEESADDTNQ